MYYEENHMTYIEDGGGCCSLVLLKLRKQKHVIAITLLLISAIVSVVAGLYNGLTLKKYSDMAIVVGIFFPSIILVFICVYLAFICGRESFRSSILSRRSSDGNHSQPSQASSQYPSANSATKRSLRVRYQPKTSAESINNSVEVRHEEPSADYCETKLSRRHLRSLSNSDIPRQMHRNCDILTKKWETYDGRNRRTDKNQYPLGYRYHQDVTQRRIFKRSISDTANKNRNKKSREYNSAWNRQSLENLRKYVDRMNLVKDEQCDCNSSYGAVKGPEENTYPLKHYKTTKEYEKTARSEEFECDIQRYNDCQKEYCYDPQKDIRTKNGNSKPEISLYSSYGLKLPCEYRQTSHFPSFPPDRKNVKKIEDTANCSSIRGQKNYSSFIINSPEIKNNRQKVETSLLESGNFRRQTINFPYTSSEESTQLSRGYAHEYCKKGNKTTQQPLSRDEENFEDDQIEKERRFYWQ